jgi:hypothetical protein
MQPLSVGSDAVIELCCHAAVWRRFDARKPEVLKALGAGAEARPQQHKSGKDRQNTKVHATNSAVRLWATWWRLRAKNPVSFDTGPPGPRKKSSGPLEELRHDREEEMPAEGSVVAKTPKYLIGSGALRPSRLFYFRVTGCRPSKSAQIPQLVDCMITII